MSFKNRYGWLDRLLHRLAFAVPAAQAGVADLEQRWFRRELNAIELGSPVLITALPRAGTTILLELVAATSTFASHTYRDMPFVLCPMSWSRISRPFRRADTPRERAHGDGIEISLDSPEAFEEIVWKLFWPECYRGSVIETWANCTRSEFVEFLSTHMREVVALRAREKPTACRYVSKNNLNIARIPAIWQALPSAIVVVLFRDPLQHAASLRNQHRRFSAMHSADAFARRYMAAIGHYDFGANFKPVNFDGWFGARKVDDTDRLDFWLEYWLATYRYVLGQTGQERLRLVGFEALCQASDLGPLAECLEIEDPQELQAGARILKPAKSHAVDATEVSPESLQAARSLYRQLQEHSVI